MKTCIPTLCSGQIEVSGQRFQEFIFQMSFNACMNVMSEML